MCMQNIRGSEPPRLECSIIALGKVQPRNQDIWFDLLIHPCKGKGLSITFIRVNATWFFMATAPYFTYSSTPTITIFSIAYTLIVVHTQEMILYDIFQCEQYPIMVPNHVCTPCCFQDSQCSKSHEAFPRQSHPRPTLMDLYIHYQTCGVDLDDVLQMQLKHGPPFLHCTKSSRNTFLLNICINP